MTKKELERRRRLVTDAFDEATKALNGPDFVAFMYELEADIEGWRMRIESWRMRRREE